MVKLLFSVIYFIESLIFVILDFFMIKHSYYSVLKAFIILFIDGIYCSFFVFYPVRRTYIRSTSFKIYYKWTQSKIKSIPYIDVSNPIWYLEKKWLKKFFYNFLWFIIKYDFYLIIFRMHYRLFIIMFSIIKLNCYL